MLGVHCSTAGGIDKACVEADRLQINTFQVFTKNQKQWKDPELKPEVVDCFRTGFKKQEIKLGFSHASYLINLASVNPFFYKSSISGMIAEVRRCAELGLAYTNFHPGYAKELTEAEAIKRIAESLTVILEETKDTDVKILLENTAGQGTSIGGKLSHIGEIMNIVQSDRLGTCFDTCHGFASGYDIRTKSGFEDTMNEMDKHVGLHRLLAFHMNDSKGALGSKLDRHEHIGKGQIGLEAFGEIMKRFPHIPKVLETPKENNMDVENLKVLRELI